MDETEAPDGECLKVSRRSPKNIRNKGRWEKRDSILDNGQ